MLDQLSCRDKLLYSQAIYELGADEWQKVSGILSNHPLIDLPVTLRSPEACAAIYKELIADLPPETEGRDDAAANEKPHARLHLRLAQKHYTARVQELRESINATEAEFQIVTNEIEQLRSGAWDDKIAAQLQAKKAAASNTGQPDVVRDRTAEIEERLKDVDEKTPTADAVIPDALPSRDVDEEMVESHATLQLDSQESEQADADKTSATASPPGGQASTKPTPKDSTGLTISVHAEPPVATSSTEEAQQASRTAEERETESPAEEQAPRRQPRDKSKQTRSSRRTRNQSPSPADEDEDGAATASEPPSATADNGERLNELQGPATAEDDSMQVDQEAAREAETDTPQRKMRPELRLDSTNSPPTAAATPDGVPPPSATRTTSSRKGKRKVSELEDRPSRPTKRMREMSENVDTGDEAEAATSTRSFVRGSNEFKKFIGMVHGEIAMHKTGNIFQRPITKAEAPDYHDIVKRPMDLRTIKSRFTKQGDINTLDEYHRDLSLMFCNALMYNRPSSDIYNMAHSMMIDCEKQVQNFFQTNQR
ncbi:hypothetical protein EXIGLDRAFT_828137 [Exidia glandulosa HHB12029]|uniref:Bromo domain-containing protein n=1 Tax=Exidia glandulosa HHB12029 TaxID=1314781 RepID=A0A165QXZ9_EXIGL|nr:hypothetical protein EXIGLDRAFT_828137 [Exidia glandulosa HHB12029]